MFIYPTQVQGSAAIGQIVSAIALANRRAEVDVLIVGRGGGSLEDLWCFNEEAVARAIANSAIPVVSAVGHEVDVTISDFAADLRAPTPSAAAELVAPDQSARAQRLAHLKQQLLQAMNRQQTAARHDFILLQKRLDHQDPKRRLEQQSQRLDELSARLQQLMNHRLHQGSGASPTWSCACRARARSACWLPASVATSWPRSASMPSSPNAGIWPTTASPCSALASTG